MLSPLRRTCSTFVLLAVVLTSSVPAIAQPTPSIDGVVADARSGLPLPNASVTAIGTGRSAETDAHGMFHLDALAPAIYQLRIVHSGYQTAQSDDVPVTAGAVAHVTLSLDATLDARSSDVIGRTATRASQSLQQSSTISRTLSTATLAENGFYRAADALRNQPSVTNSIAGDTGALGDDIPLQIRGLGAAETVTTFDGHPIASGASGGFNFQISPLVGIRSYSIIYGTGGADALGVNAIGGVIDIRTIDPTAAFSLGVNQGYGTFGRLATSAQATGTAGRLGYAVAAGVYGLDGPLRHASTYSPGLSFDPSSTQANIVNAATYPIDSSAVSRTEMGKLTYDLSPASKIGFTAFATSYWEDKTGNGDQDDIPYAYELAKGNASLAKKSAHDSCPAGFFTAVNSYNVPWGTGPNGQPDGGATNGCVTPAQYAQDTYGPAGAGPATQKLNFNDEHLAFTTATARNAVQLDLYTNRYLVTFDRSDGLPNYAGTTVNGSTTFPYVQSFGLGTYRTSLYVTSGAQFSDTLLGAHNDLAVGFTYNNAADSLATRSNGNVTVGNSGAFYDGPFVRDTYRIPQIPLTLYGSAYFLHASATNSSYVNPRLSAVYTTGPRTVLRAAVGASTTQPTANYLNQPFVPANAQVAALGAGGGATFNCNTPFSVGSAPSSILQPERGVDEEVAVGHRFWSDTNVEATFFNENVYNKIFSGIAIPINLAAPPFPLSAGFVNSVNTVLTAKCGAGNYSTAITATANLGQLRSQGVVVDGRVRFTPRLFSDLNYSVTSTVLVNGVPQLLQKTLRYVPGSQLPNVPLQTFTGALDALLTPALEGRFDFNAVGNDNTKNLPPFSYSDVSFSAPVGPGKLSVAVTNLFNQYTNDYSIQYVGVPYALNQYATAANYAPLTGTAATEQYSLPPRMLFINYALRLR